MRGHSEIVKIQNLNRQSYPKKDIVAQVQAAPVLLFSPSCLPIPNPLLGICEYKHLNPSNEIIQPNKT